MTWSKSLLLLLAACGDNVELAPDANDVDATVDAGPLDVDIELAARVGGAAFACGQTYANIGAAASTYAGTDFRLYVHDVRLVGASGDVPVELATTDFQRDGMVLLDFEDASSMCQMGTTATNTRIRGTVPAGTYTALRFVVGVPFDKNHLDATTAAAPMNVPAMYWAWSSGYKFLKLDGSVGGAGFNLHLGSTGCGVTGTTPPTAPCTSPNTFEVSLPSFTLGTSKVVIDVARVLADVDVTVNTAATAPGCMSFPGDPECSTIFPKLGLPYGAAPAGTQALFSLE